MRLGSLLLYRGPCWEVMSCLPMYREQGLHHYPALQSTSRSCSCHIAPLVWNHGRLTDWYTREDSEALLCSLQPGDLLEFHREVYYHWAVYVGRQGQQEHCVVHRANPTPEGPGKLRSASASLGSEGQGGRVVLSPLSTVWGDSTVRINNSRDNLLPPCTSDQVVIRALGAVRTEEDPGQGYNVVTNNCEHFVSWARNDLASSSQVALAATLLLQLGVALLHVKARPLLLLGLLASQGAARAGRRKKGPGGS